MLSSLRLPKRLVAVLITIVFLFIFKDAISAKYHKNLQNVDILREAKLHIFNSLAKFQVPLPDANEGDIIKGTIINIPLSCSTDENRETIFVSHSSLLDVTVEENILYANVCLSVAGKKCQFDPKNSEKFCTSVSLGIGVTKYSFPLCSKLKSLIPGKIQMVMSVKKGSNCTYLIHITRKLSEKMTPNDKLLTCAYFQTCSFITNDRLPCGIHNYADGIFWSVTNRLLGELKFVSTEQSADLYRGRIYPLWLLPCKEKCSSDSKCYWNEAKLLRFSLKDNWNREYLEGSGLPGNDHVDTDLGAVFTSSLSESTWIKMRRYMENNSIFFIGDSTLRGLMYAFIRKLNGSLYYWEASHNHIAFTLNNGKFYHRVGTDKSYPSGMIAFAYFPAFWQKRNHKLNLTAFIDQSIKREIKVKKVIIKSHQAGFHVPNYITHHFDLENHLQNRRKIDEDMWKLGYRLKWIRLDDYHLTWSRLNHFIADFQCSCHFHRIRFNKETEEYEIKGEITEALLQNYVYHLLNGEN